MMIIHKPTSNARHEVETGVVHSRQLCSVLEQITYENNNKSDLIIALELPYLAIRCACSQLFSKSAIKTSLIFILSFGF